MIRTVTIMQNVKLDRSRLVKAVRDLNALAQTESYRIESKGEHVYGMAMDDNGEYSITVSGYVDGLVTSDSLLLDCARAACFPMLVGVLAGEAPKVGSL